VKKKLSNGKWFPTNKWWTASITTAGTIVLMQWTGDGINTDPEKTVLVGLIVQRLVAYWTKNSDKEEAK
jgi:hypothetical protein